MMPEIWDDLLLAYLTDTLTPEQRATFDRLLVECEPCRDDLADWQVLAAAVRANSAARVNELPPLPAAFYQRLGAQPAANGSHRHSMTEMEENMVLGQAVHEKRKRSQGRPVTLAAAVAAVLLGGLLLLAGRGGPNPIQNLPNAGIVEQNADETATPVPTASATFTPTPIPGGSGLDPMMLTATQIIVDATVTAAAEMGIQLPTVVPVEVREITATPFPFVPMPTVVPPVSSGMQPIIAAPARLAGEVEVNGGIQEKGIVSSADGMYVAVQNGSHAVHVFAADTLELAATIDLPATTVTVMAFGGSRLAVGTQAGEVLLWSPEEPQTTTLDGDGWVTGLAFSGDGQRLAITRSAGAINTLWLADLNVDGQQAVLVYDVPLAGTVFNADGSQLVVGTLDGRVLVLDVNAN